MNVQRTERNYKIKHIYLFFQACERAESSKPCNLISSGSERIFYDLAR